METNVRIVQADAVLAAEYETEIAELVYATGPVSYDYHFPKRVIFDEMVNRSWRVDGTLFAADATRLALEGDQLLGIEIGFHGPEFRERQAALGPLWAGMLDEGIASDEDLKLVLARSSHAQWLNPVVHAGVHYVHALSVTPEARGKRVGMQLLSQAMSAAKSAGHKELQLDVLSDNPAVNFYQSMGLELLVESRAPKPQEHGVPPEWRMGIDLDEGTSE
ncbi:MAG: GNAT family N-acetyltransferase [Pseudomonadales bacterium]